MGRPIKYTAEDYERMVERFSSPIDGMSEEDRKKSLQYYQRRLRVKLGICNKINVDKIIKPNTEDDNEGKIGSRSYIASIINNHFKDKPGYISMFDFLGAGVGAEFYVKNVDRLLHLTLLDGNKCKVSKFLKEKYKEMGKNKFVNVFNMDVNDFLIDTNPFPFDVLNLDFCAYFYDNRTPNCTKGIIETAFKNGSVNKDGLLLCTFQIKGFGINMQKNRQNITVDPTDICNQIKELAYKYGYSITEDIRYEYKSSVSSRMLNVAFRLGE